MAEPDLFTEPGRHLSDDGRFVYHWPPQGRFAELWQRIELALPSDKEKHDAIGILCLWLSENGTTVAWVDDKDDELFHVDVPKWDMPKKWLDGR